VDQAFDYAQHTGDIDWIFVSNFKEFRLYNYGKKSDKWICFNYEDLFDSEKFCYFMLAFSKESYINNEYPVKLLEETLVIERQLENNFYKLFHETRMMLIKELEEFNDFNRVDAVHYAQLILNRYMFISFAEDAGLLIGQISSNTIITPIRQGNLRHNSIWQRLNELFEDINEGNEFKHISAYNGGLFEEDLDFIKIRDIVIDKEIFKDAWQEWNFEEYESSINEMLVPHANKVNPIYKNLLIISSFDFSSELDVNILGHIFENSIGDLEVLKADVKGRRKKEGIFYTPQYITDYICRNTIIPYLSKSGNSNTVDELIGEYSWSPTELEKLDKKLEKIRIVDPACGSGAFLNKAADVLLEIHNAIYDFKMGYTTTTDIKVGKGKRRKIESIKHFDLGVIVFDAIEKRREILLQNIFGVDLNEESVEITKLSLFLKVCKKGLKLPNLDNNIKCGNSLIDYPEYAGDKAFKWEKEFSGIFKEGGFDVVIGNPPYVRQEKIKEIKPYLKEHYKTYTGVADLYVYFFEKGFQILKNDGKLGYISSNKFIKSNYGKNLRELIMTGTSFERYVDHTWDKVFEGATVHSSVFIIKNGFNNDNNILVDNDFELEQNRLDVTSWSFERPEVLDLRDKINANSSFIKDISGLGFYRGLLSGYNDAFVIDGKVRNELIKKDPKSKDVIKSLLRGRDIKKWEINYKDLYILYIPWRFPIDEYISIKDHLSKFKSNLEKRPEVKAGRVDWFALSRYASDYYAEFEKEKLIYPNIAPKLFVAFDDSGFYTNQKCYIITSDTINLKYLGVLLSSKTLNFIFKFLGSTLEGKRFDLNKKYVERLPIKLIEDIKQKPYIEKADKMLFLNKGLVAEINGFKDWLQRTYHVENFSQKLDKYYELYFGDFLAELNKKKVDTTKRKTQELLEKEFEESINKINPLLQQIKETDAEIDRMVYELYELTEEEIQLLKKI
jgi:hypothetical protein